MSKRDCLYLFLYLFSCFFIITIAAINSSNLNVVDWLSFIHICLSLLLVIGITKEWLSIYTIFIALTYIFHFGQSLIRIMPFEDYYPERSVLGKVGKELLFKAEFFSIICIFFITIGYVISKNNNKRVGQTESFGAFEIKRIHQIAKFMVIITIFPMLYIDLSKVLALSSGNYEATYAIYQAGIGKYIGLIGQFCKPAISLLLFSVHHNKLKSTILFLLATAYLTFIMISGDRSTSMVYFVSNVFIYCKYVKKPSIKTTVLCVIAAFFFLNYLSAISLFRYRDFSIESFKLAYQMRSSDGPIYSTLREFGGSMISVTHAIDYFPRVRQYNMGLTYLSSVLYISPVLPTGLSNLLVPCISYIRALPTSAMDYESLGGSFLGELYYNFGWLGTLFSTIIGIALKTIDNVFNERNDVRKVSVLIVLLPSLILWVRDFFVNMIFVTFWMAFLLLYVKCDYYGNSVIHNNR